MKKTRKALMKLISIERLNSSEEEFADALIENGWVKLEEPREYWIYRKYNGCNRCNPIVGSKSRFELRASTTEVKESPTVDQIIHVREVEDND